MERPTFAPSIRVRGSEMSAVGKQQYDEWVSAGFPDRQGIGFDCVDVVCHSFVTDGMIRFLSDCTHNLRDQTVEIPNWE
jgi:hypothetical protein